MSAMGRYILAAACAVLAAMLVFVGSHVATPSANNATLSDALNTLIANLRGKGASMSMAPTGSAERLAALPEQLWPDALKIGVKRATFDAAFAHMKLDKKIFEQLANQPENVIAPWDYLSTMASDQRIETGQTKLREMDPALREIERQYGVDRHILVAIWGIESNFGAGGGDRPVIRSLATLTVGDARRAAFWRNELLAALVILDRGDIGLAEMKGSWAGAMGHTQFMPTSYLNSAVDFDGDGRRDIWHSATDALASSANYLRNAGWASGEPWGREVVLPKTFDYALTAPEVIKTAREWRDLGVTPANGATVPDDVRASVIVPAGARGPAFLVTTNFSAILKYNNATPYALAVGHLADRIAGGAPVAGQWPKDEPLLTRSEREELQERLASLGLDPGGVDGIVGVATRAAIRTYQRQRGLPEDGYPGAALLAGLRQQAAR